MVAPSGAPPLQPTFGQPIVMCRYPQSATTVRSKAWRRNAQYGQAARMREDAVSGIFRLSASGRPISECGRAGRFEMDCTGVSTLDQARHRHHVGARAQSTAVGERAENEAHGSWSTMSGGRKTPLAVSIRASAAGMIAMRWEIMTGSPARYSRIYNGKLRSLCVQRRSIDEPIMAPGLALWVFD